jgi:hypothetical protein
MVIVHGRSVCVEGRIQNQEGIVQVKAEDLSPLVRRARNHTTSIDRTESGDQDP